MYNIAFYCSCPVDCCLGHSSLGRGIGRRTVNLKHGDVAISVDLGAGRAPPLGLVDVAQQLIPLGEERQRELTDVQLLQCTAAAVSGWQGCCTVVPEQIEKFRILRTIFWVSLREN